MHSLNDSNLDFFLSVFNEYFNFEIIYIKCIIFLSTAGVQVHCCCDQYVADTGDLPIHKLQRTIRVLA